jgi:hypothetical protein
VVAIAVLWLSDWLLKVLEVRVIAGLLGGDAPGRIVDKKHVKEVETSIVEVGTERHAVVADPLGEGSLEVGVRRDAWPNIFSRSAEETVKTL